MRLWSVTVRLFIRNNVRSLIDSKPIDRPTQWAATSRSTSSPVATSLARA